MFEVIVEHAGDVQIVDPLAQATVAASGMTLSAAAINNSDVICVPSFGREKRRAALANDYRVKCVTRKV